MQNSLDRFDPSRFSSEPSVHAGPKKVRWASPPSDAAQKPPSGQRSQMHETSNASTSWYKFSTTPLLSSLPLLLVMLYLSVRDGWMAFIVDKFLQSTARVGTPSWIRYFHSPLPATTIPPDVRDYVDHAIASALRGPVPYRDFALAVDGGYVIGELTVPFDSPCPFGTFCPTNPLNAILEDSQIGRCWFVQGTKCQLGLALPEQIRPTFVSVEHIPKEIAAIPGQAPRRMVLWGVVEGDDNNIRYDQYLANFQDAREAGRNAPPQATTKARWVILSDFTYDIDARNHIQTFPIAQSIRLSQLQFGVVVLEVMDNWGAETLCLYRVRVHGELGR